MRSSEMNVFQICVFKGAGIVFDLCSDGFNIYFNLNLFVNIRKFSSLLSGVNENKGE